MIFFLICCVLPCLAAMVTVFGATFLLEELRFRAEERRLVAEHEARCAEFDRDNERLDRIIIARIEEFSAMLERDRRAREKARWN